MALSSQATTILQKRYFLKNSKDELTEDVEGLFRRVAKAVASPEEDKDYWEEKYFHLMTELAFIPNSPTLMNAGTGQGTLSACYVLPIEDTMQSIMKAASDQAMVEKFGGGVGFPLSNIRPKGYPIKTTQGKACGPIAVLKVLSEVGKMITQGGKRDGAHMAVLSVYHPDIMEFIKCKETEGVITNFNISVGVDSNFMEAVKEDKEISLGWGVDKVHYNKSIKAREIWNAIIEGAWKNGEPGMVWLDKINEDNATPALGDIQATNPCGEQPLLGRESCNLGSINLSKFVREFSDNEWIFDDKRFLEAVQIAVRFLDDVVDINNHPTPEIQEMNRQTRKIGLGVMGWADLLTLLNIPYNSDEAIILANRIGNLLKSEADLTSSDLGETKGSFPAFDKSPLNIENGGKWTSMRNAWRLSIAPTGTISMIANCSSGIEPLFALSYKKHNMSAALEDTELFYVHEHAAEIAQDNLNLVSDNEVELNDVLKSGSSIEDILTDEQRTVFVTSSEVPFEWHVKMQAVWQKYVDSGISKTINLPNNATKGIVADAYMQAWEGGCKGITVYREGSREKEVLVKTGGSKNGHKPETLDLSAGYVRPELLTGQTRRIRTSEGNLYVTINFDGDKPVEVFSQLGKAGETTPANLEAISRLISLLLQSNVPMDRIITQLQGITSDVFWDNGLKIKSLPDAIAKALTMLSSEQTSKIKEIRPDESSKPIWLPAVNGDRSVGLGVNQSSLTVVSGSSMTKTFQTEDIGQNKTKGCQECGGVVYMKEGCESCAECGWSKC